MHNGTFTQVFQTEPSVPFGGHGAFLWGLQAEAFTR